MSTIRSLIHVTAQCSEVMWQSLVNSILLQVPPDSPMSPTRVPQHHDLYTIKSMGRLTNILLASHTRITIPRQSTNSDRGFW